MADMICMLVVVFFQHVLSALCNFVYIAMGTQYDGTVMMMWYVYTGTEILNFHTFTFII